jgi:periplasmic protein CpxP/Spy
MKVRNALAIALPLAIAAFNPALVRAADEEPAAAAESQSPPAAHERHHHGTGEHVQQRLERLKTDLHITAEQQPQWSAFSNAVMQQVAQFKAAREDMKNMPTRAPERIDRQVEMMKQRLSSFEAIAQAAKTLYSALTPDQQQVADQRLLNFHHRAG